MGALSLHVFDQRYERNGRGASLLSLREGSPVRAPMKSQVLLIGACSTVSSLLPFRLVEYRSRRQGLVSPHCAVHRDGSQRHHRQSASALPMTRRDEAM